MISIVYPSSGSLYVVGPLKLIGSGTIRRSGLVELDMALLEEVGVGFEVSYMIKPYPVSQTTSCGLQVNRCINSQLLLQHHVSLHSPGRTNDDNGLNPWNCKPMNSMFSFIKSCCFHGVSSQQEKP